MKLFRIAILVIASLTGLPAATVTVVPPLSPVNVGSTFTVEFHVDAPGLYAYMMDVEYPDFLQVQGISAEGTFLLDGIGIDYDDSTPGTVLFVNDALITPGFIGPEALFSIEFLAMSPGLGSIQIDPFSVVLLGVDEEFNFFDIPVEGIQMGNIEVESASSSDVPEPGTLWMGLAGIAMVVLRMRSSQKRVRDEDGLPR